MNTLNQQQFNPSSTELFLTNRETQLSIESTGNQQQSVPLSTERCIAKRNDPISL